jgi:hypothetical protein
MHRYLRKVDCSWYISWFKFCLKELLVVAGSKQNRQPLLPCQPACCFVPAIKACSSKWIFGVATISTNTQNKAGGTYHLLVFISVYRQLG